MPVETLVVAIAAIGAIGVIHDERTLWWTRLVLAGLVVTPIGFAAHRLGRRTQALVTGSVLAGVLAALAVGVPTGGRLWMPTFSYPFLLSLLAAMLVPFVAAGRQLTDFVRRFFEHTTTWGLLCIGALAALGVVVVALEQLFGLRIDKLGGDAAIVVGCAVILVYLDRLLAGDAARPGRMPELWRRLATTIGAPFVCVMLVILAVYEATALARGELPRNMLSPLILGAGFVGFVSTLIVSSVLDETAATAAPLAPADRERWARHGTIRLMRAFPVVLLVLLPMAGWALWARVGQHGLTPFRVVRAAGLVCLACLSVAGAIRWLRGRPPLTWQVPAAILGFALVAAFGPLGAIPLTLRTQTARLARGLDAAGARRTIEQVAAPRIPVDWEAYHELAGSLRAVHELGGEPALRRVLTGAVELCMQWRDDDCLKQLGIYQSNDYDPPQAASTRYEHYTTQGRHPLATTSAVAALGVLELTRSANQPAPDASEVRALELGTGLALLADSVVAYRDGVEVARGSLAPLMAPRPDQALPLQTLSLRRADGSVAAELAIDSLQLRRDGDVAQAVQIGGAVLWLREAR